MNLPSVEPGPTATRELSRASTTLDGLTRMDVARRLPDGLGGLAPAPYELAIEWWFGSAVDAAVLDDLEAAVLRLLTPADSPLWLAGTEHVIMPVSGTPVTCKGLFLFNRKVGSTTAAFHRYWLERHAPLVPRTPGLAGYVQVHVIPALTRGPGAGYDGITELYWADPAAAEVSMGSPELTREQAGDAANFVDAGSLCALLLRSERLI